MKIDENCTQTEIPAEMEQARCRFEKLKADILRSVSNFRDFTIILHTLFVASWRSGQVAGHLQPRLRRVVGSSPVGGRGAKGGQGAQGPRTLGAWQAWRGWKARRRDWDAIFSFAIVIFDNQDLPVLS